MEINILMSDITTTTFKPSVNCLKHSHIFLFMSFYTTDPSLFHCIITNWLLFPVSYPTGINNHLSFISEHGLHLHIINTLYVFCTILCCSLTRSRPPNLYTSTDKSLCIPHLLHLHTHAYTSNFSPIIFLSMNLYSTKKLLSVLILLMTINIQKKGGHEHLVSCWINPPSNIC